jgi:RNA polymerase sigma factor (sigma-70 family)
MPRAFPSRQEFILILKETPPRPHHRSWTSEQERKVARRAATLDSQLEHLLVSRGQLAGSDMHPTGSSWAQRRKAQVDRLRASMLAVDAPPSSDVALLWREAEGLRWKLALSAWHLAERESRRVVIPELTRADLANEAAVGLYDAAIRFDPERGFLFRTYARWWIRAQTKNAVGDAHLIVRLPDSARRRRSRLLRAGLEDEAPSDVRLASAAHLRSSFASVAWQSVALDGGLTLEETTADPAASRVDDDMERTEALAVATQVLFDSDAGVHRDILLDRFGLRGSDPQTLRQLGSRIGVTAERVRQLESEALRTLRDRINRVNEVATIDAPERGETRARRLPRTVWRPRASSPRARAT